MTRTSSYAHAFRLELDIETTFSLLAEPRYLDRLTPPWFRLTPSEDMPQLEVGCELSYRLRWRGLPLRWKSRITDWVPNEFFAYEQKEGPYRFFRHEHFFESLTRGTHEETEIRDRVFFRSPGGQLADRWIARPDLHRIFAFRERRARELLRELQARDADVRRATRIPCTSAVSSVIDRPT